MKWPAAKQDGDGKRACDLYSLAGPPLGDHNLYLNLSVPVPTRTRPRSLPNCIAFWILMFVLQNHPEELVISHVRKRPA
jgi:hypothetical protein